jgi:spore coat polysaccharide biosynthesis predicted glycosyltransferase SpsG
MEVREALRPSWLIVDGYQFDVDYLRSASGGDARVMVVDDMAHLDCYPVATVLNQNAHASMLSYPADPGTRLLLGTEYALLRNEYRGERPRPRKVSDVRSVVVSAGGGDPHRVTEMVVEALARLRRSFRTTIVIGPANPRVTAIWRAASALGPDVRVLHAVPRMREVLDDADLAVSTAGSTVWELAYMGVPALLVEAGQAERLLLAGLERIGLFDRIGAISELDADTVAAVIDRRVADTEWRATMAERGMRTVDGRGVHRVLDATFGAAG